MNNISVLLVTVILCLCFAGAIVAVAGTLYLWVRRGVQDINREWGNLSITTGLTIKPAGAFSQPELTGQFRQRPIHLYTYASGTEGSRTTHTVVALTAANPTGGTLEITPAAGVAGFFGKMLKAQDVEVGDPGFDERFIVKSSPPDFAPRMLGDERLRAKIMQIPGLFRIGLEGAQLEYSKSGLEDNTDLLISIFSLLSDLADRLEGR